MPFVSSLVAMIALMERRGVRTTFANLDASNVAEQRDALAHAFLKSDATHLLFIDADMAFPPDLALTLREKNLPFVGVPCAYRRVDFDRMIAGGRIAAGLTYNVRIGAQRPADIMEAERIGMAFNLLRRDCVEAVAKVAPHYPSRYAGETIAGLFRPIALPSGEHLSEDISFCERWKSTGGRVLIYPAGDVKHIADIPVGIPFAETLLGAARAAPEPSS
jgi:hypothetical protein